jgi:hypothetical protein
MSTMTLSKEQREQLLRELKSRFEKNMKRHEGLEWAELQARLAQKSRALWSLIAFSQLLCPGEGWLCAGVL